MAAVIVLMVLTHSAYSATRLALSLTALAWQVPTVLIGVLLSLISIVPMFVSIWVGRWLDRVGTFRPLVIGALSMLIGVALPRLWPTTTALFLSSAMMGSGFLLCHMSGQQITGLNGTGALRTKHFGWLAIGFSISGFLGPMMAGYAIDYLGHLQAFSVAALLVVVALVTAVSLRHLLTHHASSVEITAPLTSEIASTLDDAVDKNRSGLGLLRDPKLARLYLCVVLISSAWDTHQFLVPIHASKIGLSASQIGWVMGAFAIATFVVRMLLPRFVGRVSHWQLLAIVLFMASFAFAIYPLLPGMLAMMAVSFFLGLGLGCGQPVVMASLYEIAPKGKVGEAAGLRQSLINATQTVLPILFGSAGSIMASLTSIAGVSAVAAVATAGSVFAPLFWLFSVTALLGGISTWRYSTKWKSR
jgi:MFS family permease